MVLFRKSNWWFVTNYFEWKNQPKWQYKVCLKSNGTEYTARTTFIAEKKALLFTSECLMVSKTKFQHSVTTPFFFARFSVKALSLWLFCENLIKLRFFGFFLLWCKGGASNNKSTWYFLSVLEKLQLKH